MPLPRCVLLVRHGETEWNREGRRQGRLDSPLTERGQRDAQQAAELCQALGPDAVFSSPLGRAEQTANVIGERLALPVELVEELAEIDHGALAGLTDLEIERRHPGLLARRNLSKYSWSFPGGESYAVAAVRGASALRSIAAVGAICPVVVTHEMIGRTLLQTLLGFDPTETLRQSLPQGAVLEVRAGASGAIVHRGSRV